MCADAGTQGPAWVPVLREGAVMACFKPLKAYKADGGKVVFTAKAGFSDRPIELSCGQCIGCRMMRRRDWAVRAMHEAMMHDDNAFVTLTYDDEHLPVGGSLRVSDWQKFAKRLRRARGAFRFFQAGEYGGQTGRPHYHACIFGLGFVDGREIIRTKPNLLWKNRELEEVWGMGSVVIGSVSAETAAYVAKYTMKDAGGEGLTSVSQDTGEVFDLESPKATMSRRPGLGTSWLEKYGGDQIKDGWIWLNGKKHRAPSFYTDRLDEVDLVELKRKRRDWVQCNTEKDSELRMKQRERHAELSSQSRGL